MTKILLVEDDKSLREIYGVRLLAEGYDIVSAGDGEDALAMAIKERPDLIISDVMMPKISGFDMLDILRSTTETRDIKVIMMTALSSDDQRARGEQLGADRYLVKSQVGIEDVVRTVHEVMNDANKTTATAEATPAAAPVVSSEASLPVAAQPSEPSPAPVANTTPTPAESSLPQPTAPFSSPKPDNLGERVINPIENPNPQPSLDAQIQNELASTTVPTNESESVQDPTAFAAQPPQVTEPVSQPADDSVASQVDDTASITTPAQTTDDQPISTAPSEPLAEEPAADSPVWQAPTPQQPSPETPNPQDEQQRNV